MEDARDLAARDVRDMNASPQFVRHDVQHFRLRFSWSELQNQVVVIYHILHLHKSDS